MWVAFFHLFTRELWKNCVSSGTWFGLVCRKTIWSCKKPMLSELGDKRCHQNTFYYCVLFQVEQLTIALNRFTGMFYLCVILNCTLVTLPCYSRPIIFRYTELCTPNWTICYIHKLNSLKCFQLRKKWMFTFTEKFCWFATVI